MSEPPVAAVIFDLGGVIVRLGPLSDLLGYEPPSSEEFWTRWLHSETVRDFEGGHITTEQFSNRMVTEFELPFGPVEMVDRFRAWPKGLYPGAARLLSDLGSREDLTLGALSNSNPIHWNEQQDAAAIRFLFDTPFLSFEMKLIKPDAAIFKKVQAELHLPPAQILYFDDNQINVAGARAAGWQAEVANGPDECRRHLEQRGLLGTLDR